jgi:hypothetical protein
MEANGPAPLFYCGHPALVGRESIVAFTSAPNNTAAAKRYKYTSTTMAALKLP